MSRTIPPLPHIDDKATPGYTPGPGVRMPAAAFNTEARPQTWYEWLFCIPAPRKQHCDVKFAAAFNTDLLRGSHCAGADNPDPLQEVADRKYAEKVRHEHPYV